MPTGGKVVPLEIRFWKKVQKSEGCWLWTASKVRGYGQIGMPMTGKLALAHRVSWEFVNGPVPPDMLVCHKCDTPACVRPDHLFLGTYKDNMADSAAKGRHPRNRTHYLPTGKNHHFYNKGMKITREIAIEIRNCGGSNFEAAQRFGIDKSMVSKIRHGHHWK